MTRRYNILLSEKATIKESNHSPRFRKVSEVFCRTGKQFPLQVPEGTEKKTGDSIYKSKKRTIAMLPLATKDTNEIKSRSGRATVERAARFTTDM